MAEVDQQKNNDLLQPVNDGQILYHTLLKARDWRKVFRGIVESATVRSSMLVNNENAVPVPAAGLDYEIQCSEITGLGGAHFGANDFTFIFTPEALKQAGARLIRRDGYPGIVTRYSAGGDKIGGAEVPFPGVVLGIRIGVGSEEINEAIGLVTSVVGCEEDWARDHILFYRDENDLRLRLGKILNHETEVVELNAGVAADLVGGLVAENQVIEYGQIVESLETVAGEDDLRKVDIYFPIYEIEEVRNKLKIAERYGVIDGSTAGTLTTQTDGYEGRLKQLEGQFGTLACFFDNERKVAGYGLTRGETPYGFHMRFCRAEEMPVVETESGLDEEHYLIRWKGREYRE